MSAKQEKKLRSFLREQIEAQFSLEKRLRKPFIWFSRQKEWQKIYELPTPFRQLIYQFRFEMYAKIKDGRVIPLSANKEKAE